MYIEVNGVVFSYGRYDGSYSPISGGLGLVGKGILLRYSGEDAISFIKEKNALSPTKTYIIDRIDSHATFDYLNRLYNQGIRGDSNGKYVNTYYLVGNNCTTIVCDALNAGGSNIDVFQTPATFNKFLSDVERMKSGWNPGLLQIGQPK